MNSIDVLSHKPVLQALGWALVHFIWQGALVASLFSLINSLIRKRSANLRYVLACGALVLLMVLPIVTFSILFLSNSRPAPSAAAATCVEATVLSDPSPSAGPVILEPKEVLKTGAPVKPLAGSVSTVCAPPPSQQPIASEQPQPVSASIRDRFTSAFPWLVALWLAGVLGLSIRFAGGFAFTLRLKRELNRPACAIWQERAASLCSRLRISRPVVLCESALVEAPTVIGWLRPAILVPASALAGLAAEKVEALLAHELAHIRRYDYLVNLMQTAIETLLFYHPAVWWISNQIRVEREHCCDDIAVAACGDVLMYVRALADLEDLRASAPQLAVAASGGSLLSRIERLVGRPRRRTKHEVGPQLAGLLSVAAVFALLASASGAFTPPPGTVGNRATSKTEFLPIAAVSKSAPGANSNLTPAIERTGAVYPSAAEKGLMPEPLDEPSSGLRQADRLEDSLQSVSASSQARQTDDYIDQMAAAGFKNLTIDQLIELRQRGVTPEFAKSMKEAGYDDLSVRDLVNLKIHGITSAYVQSMASAGFSKMPIQELVGLHTQGVTAEYIQGLKSQGYGDLPGRTIGQLKAQGVTPDYIKAMKEVGFDKASPRELIALRTQGVDTAYVKKMREAGFENLSVRDLISLRTESVSPEYIKEIKSVAGTDALSARHIIALRTQGVTADYVRGLVQAGLSDLSPDRIVNLKMQSITGDYIQQMRSAGLKDLSASQMMSLKAHGVDPEYVKDVRLAFSADISAEALISFKTHGIDSQFITAMKQAGYPRLSASDLVALKIQNVTPRYVMELKASGYPGATIREIIQAKMYGITPEFIKQVKDRGFKDLTLRQLIRLKVSGVLGPSGQMTNGDRILTPWLVPERRAAAKAPAAAIAPKPDHPQHVEVWVYVVPEQPVQETEAAPQAAPEEEDAATEEDVEISPCITTTVTTRDVRVLRYRKVEVVKARERSDA